MRPASCKAKGRRLQQIVRDAILKAFPFRVEAKNRERYGRVYDALDQAASHPGAGTPIAVLKSNHRDPIVVIALDSFMKLTAASRTV